MNQSIKSLNIYDQFIKYLQQKEKRLNLKEKYLEKNSNLEKHHILPLHAGGKQNGKSVICNSRNHTLAHYYRYLTFKQKGDLIAFQMRWNQKLGSTERALLAVEKNKELKNTFWNSEWQSQQGKKSSIKQKQNKQLFYNSKWQSKQAKKAGLKNTEKQKSARKKVGKGLGLKYGKQNGLNRQSYVLKKMLSKETIWIYNNKNIVLKKTIKPQKSFSNLIDILQLDTPTTIKKASFYQVIHGTRPQMYGWQLFFIKL